MNELARVVPAVAVFVFRRGRMLAMRRSPRKDAAPGAWEALSGRIEPGEQPIEAARREAREESGLEVRIDDRPMATYVASRGAEPMLVIAFAAGALPGEVVLSEEHDRFAWMTLEEFAAACPFAPLVEAARLAALSEVAAEAR